MKSLSRNWTEKESASTALWMYHWQRLIVVKQSGLYLVLLYLLVNLKWQHNLDSIINFYRTQTKLWEGNVFTGVCLSTGGSHGALDLMVPTPPTFDLGTYPSPWIPNMGPTHCYWHLMVITEDLFKLVHLRTYTLPPPNWDLVVTTKTCTFASEWYASYWNAFFFSLCCNKSFKYTSE